MSRRIFLIGTDTNVGKTITTCCLLREATRIGVRAIPFKPAASGPHGPASDTARLIDSSKIPLNLHEVTPLHYENNIAPGMADDPHYFLQPQQNQSLAKLQALNIPAHLDQLETIHAPRITFIEGAGGLFVPMPNQSWQQDWIQELLASVIIVAHQGLGTINHTLLTIEALRSRAIEPLGVIYTNVANHQDASAVDNATVIQARSGLSPLAHLPYLGNPILWPDSNEWLHPNFWQHLGIQHR